MLKKVVNPTFSPEWVVFPAKKERKEWVVLRFCEPIRGTHLCCWRIPKKQDTCHALWMPRTVFFVKYVYFIRYLFLIVVLLIFFYLCISSTFPHWLYLNWVRVQIFWCPVYRHDEFMTCRADFIYLYLIINIIYK